MKPFLDALSVFLGNLLHARPSSWAKSKEQAEEMRRAFEYFKPNENVVGADGAAVEEEPPMSPVAYLLQGLLNGLAVAIAVYLVCKSMSYMAKAVPVILFIAFALWLGNEMTKPDEA